MRYPARADGRSIPRATLTLATSCEQDTSALWLPVPGILALGRLMVGGLAWHDLFAFSRPLHPPDRRRGGWCAIAVSVIETPGWRLLVLLQCVSGIYGGAGGVSLASKRERVAMS